MMAIFNGRKQFIVRTSRRYREMLTLRGGDYIKMSFLYYNYFKTLVAYIRAYIQGIITRGRIPAKRDAKSARNPFNFKL